MVAVGSSLREDPTATITTSTGGCRVSIFYTPDDGRMTPETCRVLQ